jgi:hypothetical protein
LSNVQIAVYAENSSLAARPGIVLSPRTDGTAGAAQPILEALLNGFAGNTSPASSPDTPTTFSDANGQFSISGLSPGSYVLTAQLAGYFGPPVNGVSPTNVRTTFNVSEGKSIDVAVVLISGGAITGLVLDPNGMPVSNMNVQALRTTYPSGMPTLQLADTRQTDDRGVFRLYGLPPGSYYVAANSAIAGGRGRGGAAPESTVFARTYLPDVTDAENAVLLRLHSAEELSGMNLKLKPANGTKISGQVISAIPASEMVWPARAANATPQIPNANLTLVPHRKDAVQDSAGGNYTITVPLGDPVRGQFEFSGIAPGIYDLYASVPDIQGYGPAAPPGQAVQPAGFGRVTVDVTSGDRSGVTVSPHHGVDVSGKVTIDGGIPDSINKVQISLQADDSAARINTYPQVGRYVPTIDKKGAFVIPAVPEAHYRFQINFGTAAPSNSDLLIGIFTGDPGQPGAGARGGREGRGEPPSSAAAPPPSPLPPNTYVADVLQGGLSIYDNGLLITDQSIVPVEVVVRTNGGGIDGIVRDATQQSPAPGAIVVLVPQVQHRQNPSLFKSAIADAVGHFTFTAISPGNYKLFAWDNIEPGEFQNATFLGQYEEKGVAVNVAPAIHLDTTLTVIPMRR